MTSITAAIGFTALLDAAPAQIARSQAALDRALAHFPDIEQKTLEIGRTRLTLWGRKNLENCHHQMADGSTLALIGSPLGESSWDTVANSVQEASGTHPFTLPWDGRVVLLHINPAGDSWTLWNDWVGSIPVYRAQLTGQQRMLSTLEPVAVETAGCSPDDISLPSVLALMIWGHYFSDWTLFENIRVVPADSEITWDESGFRYARQWSVPPNTERWESGWDDLIDEMHAFSKNAIAAALQTHSRWVLPLSSGLDSRLIAGVAAELGVEVHAYTWGAPKTSDVIHARKIAQTLGIPWKAIDLGEAYLTEYQPLWANLFGSAMHFHGMYQMPFLDALRSESPAPLISGFLGDCLAGYDIKLLTKTQTGPTPYQLLTDDYLHWNLQVLATVMNRPIAEAMETLAAEFQRQIKTIPGAPFQKWRYLVIWGRQRFFTYFQSMLSDYWRGVATPYIHREYARFSFSLPKAVLDGRIMQQAMLRRYYPKLAAIPGSYAREPALLTGSYLLKKRFARYLPQAVSKTLFPELQRVRLNSDIACVQRSGKLAFTPLFEQLDQLAPWVKPEVVEAHYRKIGAENNIHAVRQMQSLQALAYRIHPNPNTLSKKLS